MSATPGSASSAPYATDGLTIIAALPPNARATTASSPAIDAEGSV
jgi:hypothetical protein